MRVQQLTKSGEVVAEFENETAAAASSKGLSSTLIKWVCEGKRSSHGGFAWKYIEDGTDGDSGAQEVALTLGVISSNDLVYLASSKEDYTIPEPIYIIFYHAGFSSKPLDKYYLSLDNAIADVRAMLDESELIENDSLERNHINKYRFYLRNSNYYEIMSLTKGD